MPIFPSRRLPDPIPFALHLSSKQPISLPLLTRAKIPSRAVVQPKTKKTIRTDHLSHNPVKLLYQARLEAEEKAMKNGRGHVNFPRNLKIESVVDEGEEYNELSTGIRRHLRDLLAKKPQPQIQTHKATLGRFRLAKR
jgi:hypothetical protein